jgi:cold shock CspA family protein
MNEKILRTGRVGAYNCDKGYGFIYEDTNDKKLCSWFFHISACAFEPQVGSRVQFRIAPGPKGLMAIEVDLLVPSALDVLSGKAGAQ